MTVPPSAAALTNREESDRDTAALVRRAAMLEAVATAAVRFIGQGDWLSSIEELLARLGDAMTVARAGLFQAHALSTGGHAQACLFEWTAPGVPRRTDDPARRIACFGGDCGDGGAPGEAAVPALRRGDTVVERAPDGTCLLVPVMVDGGWWGHIALHDPAPSRDWTAQERDLLGSAALLLAGTIRRTQIDTELHRSEARRRSMVDSALDCVLTIDGSGLLVEFNPAAERTLGYRRADVLGRRMEDLIIPPATRAAHHAGFARYLSGGGGGMIGRRIEVTAMRADGSEFPAELSIAPTRVYDELFFTAFLRDITERKAAERALLEAKARAEAAAQAKTTILATMSHELRTPLNAIIGFSELLKGQALGPLGNGQYQEFAADIHEGGQHLLGIINDVLDMARIEAGEHRLSCETIDLGAVVRSCLTMMRDHAVKGEVSLIDDTGVLPVPLWADRRAVMKVLLNLLSNAVKFTPPGGSARVGAVAEADGAVTLTVGDTGRGIAPDHLERVFDPFQQGDGGLDRRHAGAGLGLPVARALVELHGGRITLDSTPGAGTTATLWFPPPEGA